jgi:hypothetical protein
MRENHPFFDSPLFFVGRNSALRLWCLQIVEAKYNSGMNDEGGGMNGSFRGANPTTAATMMGGGMNSNGRRPLATVNIVKGGHCRLMISIAIYSIATNNSTHFLAF